MRSIVLAVLVLAACTKPNPNVCCTDEADCNAKGIPLGSQCGEGLLCRGNQCIAQPCASSASCDSAAPYCVAETCAETCTDDAQCPGFSQSADVRFCESGACTECRTDTDCQDAAKPVCDAGTCRGCTEHAECASGVCGSDGICVAEANIAYVDPTGSGIAPCTATEPCNSIARALSQPPPFVLVSSGSYASSSELVIGGERHLIGRGSTRPIITRTTAGRVVDISNGNVTLEYLEVRDATNGTDDGDGIRCTVGSNTPTLHLRRMLATSNASSGLHATGCVVDVLESTFSKNGTTGVFFTDGTGTFDRCLVSENVSGMGLDGGLYSVTNSMIVRNYSPSTINAGIDVYTTEPGTKIEFNTIADNSTGNDFGGQGINCNLQGTTASFPNNIIARNKRATGGTNCTYPGSIIVDNEITALGFKSPDTAPFDYHITSASSAIDAAAASNQPHDFDGEARPSGSLRDVGADEYVP